MQDRALATRISLLRAAANVVDEVGVAAASMDAISQRAGTSKGALYFHFRSKDLLLAELAAHARSELQKRLNRLVGAPGHVLVDVKEFTTDFIDLLRADVVVRAGLRSGQERISRPEVDPDESVLALTAAALHQRVRAAPEELLEAADPTSVSDLLTVVMFGSPALADLVVSSPARLNRVWDLLITVLASLDTVDAARRGAAAAGRLNRL